MADPGEDDNNENTETTASQQTSGSGGSSTNGSPISTPTPGPEVLDQSWSEDHLPADNPLQGAIHVSQSPVIISSQTRDKNEVVLCDNGRKLMMSNGRMIEALRGRRFIIQTQKTPTGTATGYIQNPASKAVPDGTNSTDAGQNDAENPPIFNAVQERSTELPPHFNQVVLCDNGRKLVMSDGQMIEALPGQRFIIQTQKPPSATAQGQEQTPESKAVSDGTKSTSTGQKDAANPGISNAVQETSTEVTPNFNQVNI